VNKSEVLLVEEGQNSILMQESYAFRGSMRCNFKSQSDIDVDFKDIQVLKGLLGNNIPSLVFILIPNLQF
jgi:hypothetical protein